MIFVSKRRQSEGTKTMIDFQTKLVAREICAATDEHDSEIAWTKLLVRTIDGGDAHFFVMDESGQKYRVTITPEA